MPAFRILVAEDDAAIRDLLVHHLEREGFDVIAVADGNAALRAARRVADLLVLDLGLPGVNGLEVARRLRRERREIPIVMLTARSDEVDRIVGLELGADDYVVKPFSPRELIARVRAVMRRSGMPGQPPGAVMTLGHLEIDEAAREVRVNGTGVKLTPREFALLVVLANSPGVALSRRVLLDRVWGYDYDGDERTVDVHIRRLRIAIGDPVRGGTMLQTIHGFGYKFSRA